jgi:hypothetical protein
MMTDLKNVTGATEGYVRLYATVSQHKTKTIIKILQIYFGFCQNLNQQSTNTKEDSYHEVFSTVNNFQKTKEVSSSSKTRLQLP